MRSSGPKSWHTDALSEVCGLVRSGAHQGSWSCILSPRTPDAVDEWHAAMPWPRRYFASLLAPICLLPSKGQMTSDRSFPLVGPFRDPQGTSGIAPHLAAMRSVL